MSRSSICELRHFAKLRLTQVQNLPIFGDSGLLIRFSVSDQVFPAFPAKFLNSIGYWLCLLTADGNSLLNGARCVRLFTCSPPLTHSMRFICGTPPSSHRRAFCRTSFKLPKPRDRKG